MAREVVVSGDVGAELALVPASGSIARADQNAAAIYLARLDERTSRPTQASCLRQVSRMLLGPGFEQIDEIWLLVPWGTMRYGHVRKIFGTVKGTGAAPATLRRYVVALRSVASEARRLRQMSADDYADIRDDDTFKYGERLPPGRMLGAAEVERLYLACTADLVGWRNGALLALLETGGPRRDEAARARTQNYDPDAGSLKIIGKRDIEREVVLPRDASRAIDHWLARRGVRSPWLFPHMHLDRSFDAQKPMTGGGVLYALRLLAKDAGVGEFGVHDLRRTYISSLLAKGVDLVAVSKLVGHKSTSTTAKYDRRALEAQRELVNKHFAVRFDAGWWK